MKDLIYLKCGALASRAEMPKLAYDSELGAEIGYRTDKKELYIGSGSGNIRLCGADDVAEINTKIDAINKQLEDIIARLDALTPGE